MEIKIKSCNGCLFAAYEESDNLPYCSLIGYNLVGKQDRGFDYKLFSNDCNNDTHNYIHKDCPIKNNGGKLIIEFE